MPLRQSCKVSDRIPLMSFREGTATPGLLQSACRSVIAKPMAPDSFDTESPDDRALWSLFLRRAAGEDIMRPPDLADDHPFWSLYAPIAHGNGAASFVVAQLGQSLD